MLSMVAELVVAAGDPAPLVSAAAAATAASTGPKVVAVLAGTTHVVVFRDAAALVPAIPRTACAVVAPSVASVPGAPLCCVC